MKSVFRFAKIAMLICLQLGSALAGNEHEHLHYLPRFQDIQNASEGNLGNYAASKVINPKNNLNGLKDKFGPSLFTDDEWKTLIQNESLDGFCQKVSEKIGNQSSREIMESLFEVRNWHHDAKGSYQASGTYRLRLFENSQMKLVKSVENYLNVTKNWQNNKVIFSVPHELVNSKILGNIQALYQERGYQVQFLYSITRNNLQASEFKFQPTLEQVEKGVKEGWLHGIDVSGSIREDLPDIDNAKRLIKKERVQERLEAIFRQSNRLKSPIRVHAFEKGNTGDFYDSFWNALQNAKKKKQLPKVLRIGHIQEVDNRSIKKFYPFRYDSEVLFEANIESNIGIQDSNTKKLARKIESLHRNGFKVMLGNDGAGILGQKSNYVVTLERLKRAGLDQDSLRQLIDDSFTPIPGMELDRNTGRIWEDEKNRIKDITLKRDRAPYVDSCRNWFRESLLKTVIYSDFK